METGTIKEFYSGEIILLTGATGVIGRLLLAKLMRLGNVGEVLLLTRPKKGMSNEDRLKVILKGFLFEEMEKYDKNFANKLRIINGDIELENLGMSVDDRNYIKEHVRIIIHGAATVRFDDPLRKAVAINILGTKKLLDLAMDAKRLQSFVHISTAYSQCPRRDIREVFYEPAIDYRKLLEVCAKFDDDVVNAVTSSLIAPWPNTYTFTKAVTEDMIRQYKKALPIAIVRPSIVQATHKDPVGGYSDTIMGAMGMGVGIITGVLRVMKLYPEVCIDIVPADFTVNTILVVAACNSRRDLTLPASNIYHSVVSNIQPIPMAWIYEKYSSIMQRFPTNNMLWLPHITFVRTQFMYDLLFLLYHYLPAFFIDIALRLKGSDLRLVKIYSKIYYYFKLYSYFDSKTWTFPDDNLKILHSIMSAQDHDDFLCTGRGEDYEQHYVDAMNGIRKFFFKETDEDLVRARRKLKVLKVFDRGIKMLFFSSLAYIIYPPLVSSVENRLAASW